MMLKSFESFNNNLFYFILMWTNTTLKKLFHLQTKNILVWVLGPHTCHISASSSTEHAEFYDILFTYSSELLYVKSKCHATARKASEFLTMIVT